MYSSAANATRTKRVQSINNKEMLLGGEDKQRILFFLLQDDFLFINMLISAGDFPPSAPPRFRFVGMVAGTCRRNIGI
jgi:hypothetical protein